MEISESINGLINSYIEGTATEGELKSLLVWLKADKQNVRYFNQICNLWENTFNVSDREQQTENALNKLNARIRNFEKEGKTKIEDSSISESSGFFFWRYAAMAVILIGLSVLFYFVIFQSPETKTVKYYTAMAPVSQKSRLILSDGTRVWLNSGTTLKYKSNYGEETRDVFLDGEAYFEVAKDASKPFLVHAANITVKAIGTSFNVKCYPDEKTIEATLVEGKVQVYQDNRSDISNSVLLNPNERAVFNKNSSKLLVSKIEAPTNKIERQKNRGEYLIPKTIASVISWKDQELVFENETFSELSKRLERWYNVEIEIRDTSVLEGNSYTGKFVHNESLEQVLRIISRTTPIKYTVKSGIVIVESR